MTDVCWAGGPAVGCDRTDVRRYLNVIACPDHTPATVAGRNEPGRTSYQVTPRFQTPASAKGGTDINKQRPGGYVSRQGAQAIAQGRRPRQTR